MENIVKTINSLKSGNFIQGTLGHYDTDGIIQYGNYGKQLVFVSKMTIVDASTGLSENIVKTISIKSIPFNLPEHYKGGKLDNGKSVFSFVNESKEQG